MGVSGKYPQHMSDEFLKIIDSHSPCLLPQPFQALIPYKSDDQWAAHIMLPHELFASLYHNYRDAWSRAILPEQPNKSWESCGAHPQMQGHPMLCRENWKSLAVPIGMHGDAVPVTGIGKVAAKCLDVFSWTSLISSGKTINVNYYIWSVYHAIVSKADGRDTMDEFFKVLKWSLEAMYEGKWPTHNHKGCLIHPRSQHGKRAGQDLADGYFGIMFGSLGDLDYFAADLGLPRHSANSPCPLCRATTHGPTHWQDCRVDAAWLGECWTPVAWKAWPGRSQNQLFSLPGVRALTVALDYMHCKYLGMDQYIFGSILYILCFLSCLGYQWTT